MAQKLKGSIEAQRREVAAIEEEKRKIEQRLDDARATLTALLRQEEKEKLWKYTNELPSELQTCLLSAEQRVLRPGASPLFFLPDYQNHTALSRRGLADKGNYVCPPSLTTRGVLCREILQEQEQEQEQEQAAQPKENK